MSTTTISTRMEQALADLEECWNGKRRPKAFYLITADYDAFLATDPPSISTIFGNNPPRQVIDPAFNGLPVRESTGQASRLYDHTSTGRAL